MSDWPEVDVLNWWPQVSWQDADVLIIIHAPTLDGALAQLDHAVQDHAWGRVNWRRMILGL